MLRPLTSRIVITDFDGKFLDHIGGNGPQLIDGGFESAGFNRPQGLVYCSKLDSVFCADTENHAIRQVSKVFLLRNPWSASS